MYSSLETVESADERQRISIFWPDKEGVRPQADDRQQMTDSKVLKGEEACL